MRCTNACVGESVPLSLSSATVSAFYTSVTLYTTFNVAAVNGRRLRRDWDVVDEGPRVDLLGIQIKHNSNGSVTLHQEKYIDSMLARFYPKGLPHHVSRGSLPHSSRLERWEAD